MGFRIRHALASAALALFCFMASAIGLSAAALKTETLLVHRQDGETVSFKVELALDASQRRQGLMGRREMALDSGMLFDFGEDRRVQMWMHDTHLPLDMLFISREGIVSHIRTNAVPMSRDIIDSRGTVRFVLELNGGATASFGIETGDRVSSPRIDAARSAQ